MMILTPAQQRAQEKILEHYAELVSLQESAITALTLACQKLAAAIPEQIAGELREFKPGIFDTQGHRLHPAPGEEGGEDGATD